MERRPRAPQRRGQDHPSFSSTLLDAIYRSIDAECERRSASIPAGATVAHRDRPTGGAPDCPSIPVTADKKTATAHRPGGSGGGERKNAAGRERDPSRRRRGVSGFPAPISTSSSSDNSSYGGFSSSEPESATAHHPQVRLRPIRTAPDVSAATRPSNRPPRHAPPLPPPRSAPSKSAPSPPSPAAYVQEMKKAASIRSKLRDLRKPKTPSSPGARLAGFLNSLFASAGGNPRKSKGSPAVTPSAVFRSATTTAVDESACSTASSYYRSCLSKTPASRGARHAPAASEPAASAKRSVRFCVVDEDLRPCGQKSIYEEVRAAQPPLAAASGRVEREAKRRVEELLRRYEGDEEGSDSSSDLFELEIGTGSGGAGAGLGYRDELPVYETTDHHHVVRTNRPISHHF